MIFNLFILFYYWNVLYIVHMFQYLHYFSLYFRVIMRLKIIKKNDTKLRAQPLSAL